MNFVLDELEDIQKVENYFDRLFSSVIVEADEILYEKYLKARSKSGFTRRKSGKSLVRIRGYIIPSDVAVVSTTGIPMIPRIASNPAIQIHDDNVHIYLRLASIGSVFSRTFIAVAESKIENLRGRIKVEAHPILYGIMPYECVEDPRVDPEDPGVLYHVRALYRTRKSRVFTFQSHVKNREVDKLEVISFYSKEWGVFLLQDYRDTFPINRDYMMIRPFFKDRNFGVMAVGPRDGAKVNFDEMDVIPELLPSKDEYKTGGNASLKLSASEYLVLYHVVDNHGVYYTYAALFDNSGELLASTETPVIAPKVGVYSGGRPSTVFVCGLALYDDKLLISAGRDDEITLIYEGELEEIMEKMKFFEG